MENRIMVRRMNNPFVIGLVRPAGRTGRAASVIPKCTSACDSCELKLFCISPIIFCLVSICSSSFAYLSTTDLGARGYSSYCVFRNTPASE